MRLSRIFLLLTLLCGLFWALGCSEDSGAGVSGSGTESGGESALGGDVQGSGEGGGLFGDTLNGGKPYGEGGGEDTGSDEDIPPFWDDAGSGKDTEPEEDVEQCGVFGETCSSNPDCCSEYCIETYNGYQCTDLCVENCPEGYECKAVLNSYPDVITICVPKVNKLCSACTSDFQCNGGACIDIGGSDYCTVDCSLVECPEGYSCAEQESGASWCLPDNDSCDCGPGGEGLLKPCANQNDSGICQGVEVCDPETGWSECDADEPMDEICNGLDDNCNGAVDEGLPVTEHCILENEFGVCEGEAFCQGGAGWVCSVDEPTIEICDYKDNNCNGLIDEDFKDEAGKYAALHHCGGCAKSCEGLFPNGSATCDASGAVPQCVVEDCHEGFYQDGLFLCLPSQDTLCDPCIEDFQCGGGICVGVGDGNYCTSHCEQANCPSGYQCLPAAGVDGAPKGLACVPVTGACDCLPGDEGQKKPCTQENEIGICLGFRTCEANTGWSDCDALDPGSEICNGVDDDCDGFIDDGLPGSQPCTNDLPGVGSCDGVAHCMAAGGWVCDAQDPAVELCDYQDNDCDEEVDEAFKNADGKYGSLFHCGACNASCEGATPNGTSECDDSGITPICIVDECDPGFYKLNDFVCLPEGDSTCKPCETDAQCDGITCVGVGDGKYCSEICVDDVDCPGDFVCGAPGTEGFCVPPNGTCDCSVETAGAKKLCEVGNAVGVCYGFRECIPEIGWDACSAIPAESEVCDGVDNDCNGFVDDGLAASQACISDNEFGTCSGSAGCQGALGWVCNAPEPEVEVCDFSDNNCDGQLDEGFKNADGKYASDEHCGTCFSACGSTIPNASEEVCDGTKATPTCIVLSCEEGYFLLNEFQCVETPDVTCFPCSEDSDCFGGSCVLLDDGSMCLPPCANDSDCTNGFVCDGTACMPLSGTCDCTLESAGAKKFCSKDNEEGSCLGFSTCDPLVGWSECDAALPAGEICNGIDDDCDGVPDDGIAASQPCEQTNEFGLCSGEAVCLGNAGWVCQANIPGADVCDFIDNDCDGDVDEDFKNVDGKYVTMEHCGTCGQACGNTIANSLTETCDISKPVPQCIAVDCLPGFYKQSDLQCSPVPAVSCTPCVSDDSCFGGACVEVDTGSFCLEGCADDGICPAGYSCDDQVCFPDNESCDCTEASAGATRTCQITNVIGTCIGYETCDPSVGWTNCTAGFATNEDCDGIDNDCNGLIDDGLPATQVCATKNDFGQCSGFAQCYGNAGWICLAPAPEEEICDFKDNDCDEITDEGFVDASGKYTGVDHCGTCNNPCGGLFPNSLLEICDASGDVPQCIIDECEEGYVKISNFQCLEIPNIACTPCLTDANCFGSSCMQVDTGNFCLEDCDNGLCSDGYFCSSGVCQPWNGTCDCTEDTVGSKRSCSSFNELGMCFGFETCDPAFGWGDCDAPSAQDEICNGFDDDCNGFIDDGIALTQGCAVENEFGVCSGTASCFGTVGWFCQAPEPGLELCDYTDNDCDGSVDEDFKTADGLYGLEDHCGECGNECDGAILNGVSSCDTSLPIPQCTVNDCEDGWEKFNDFLCIPTTSTLCEPCVTNEQCLVEGAECVALVDGNFCSIPCSQNEDCPDGYFCQSVGADADQCIPATSSCSCDGSNLDLQMGCSISYEPPAGGPTVICFGSQYCTEGGWTDCNVPSESCNSLDDDCDGSVDEDFKNAAGDYFSDEHCGKCNMNCLAMDFENGGAACVVEDNVASCHLNCDEGFFDVNLNPADGCECSYTNFIDEPDGVDQNCDSVDGEIENGIFVSKQGSDANEGTIDAPMLTLNAAIDRAFNTNMRDVYIATGVYSENVLLLHGVSTYGGYNGDFTVRDPDLYETAILGQAPIADLMGAVNAIWVKGDGLKTRLDGFIVFGADNQTPGGNSYALFVQDCDYRVEITNNRIYGGSGGNGPSGGLGADGDDGNDGADGSNGFDTGGCVAGQVSSGGERGLLFCDSQDVSGGDGGMGFCPYYDQASQNSTESGAPGFNGGGLGGEQGYDSLISDLSGGSGDLPAGCEPYAGTGCNGCACETCVCNMDSFCCNTQWDTLCAIECSQNCGQDCSAPGGGSTGSCALGTGSCNECLIPANWKSKTGLSGNHGAIGGFGAGGQGCTNSVGQVLNGVWLTSSGGVGQSGGHGGGGGGGGAGGGTEVCGCGGDDVGGTGGGGGSGGCAGTEGIGGSGGGGSFGIFVTYTAAADSIPLLAGNDVIRGVGGMGGSGGNGGVGGLSGTGGLGGGDAEGNPDAWCIGMGGDGGDGGVGGHGGGGGGGCGGSSYGVYVWGQGGLDFSSVQSTNNFPAGGSGGLGGPGGLSLGNSGLPGQSGTSTDNNL